MPQQTPHVPVPLNMSDWYPWAQLMARAINGTLAGQQNIINTITLNPNSTSTTLSDTRIGAHSYIGLSPMTETAATETLWIGTLKKGSATINHSSSADMGRTYRVLIIA